MSDEMIATVAGWIVLGTCFLIPICVVVLVCSAVAMIRDGR